MDKLQIFFKQHGVLLGLFRLPFRLIEKLLNVINTLRWKLLLKNVGPKTIIELGVVIENPRQVVIGSMVRVKRGAFLIAENLDGLLVIESSVQINNNVRIDHTGNILIGANTMISDGVKIYSHSHGRNPRSNPVPIDKEIGANTWIGVDAVILENCHMVGSNVIIAACSVVTKDVPSNSFVKGYAARL